MLGGGLEVGRVYARVGATLDDDGFDRWERRYESAERKARDPVDAKLGTRIDHDGFDRYDRRLRDVDDGHNRVTRSGGRMASFLGGGLRAGGIAAAAGIGAAVVAGKEFVGAFSEAERVGAQTDAVLKSTRGEAGLTAKEISALATEVSRYSGIDDEAVQSAENLLLTFTNVRNEVGKGNDVFNQATKAAADMSTALGTDMSNSAILVGKALNDPVRGLTALRRAGVSFTEAQQEQIKSMVEANDAAGAQKIILAELQKEFGGSAKAAGDTFSGSLNKAKVAIGNVAEAAGGWLAPKLRVAADWVTRTANALTDAERPAGLIGARFKEAGQAVGDAVGWIVGAIGDLARDRGVQEFVGKTGRFIGALADEVGNVVEAIIDKVKEIAPDLETVGRAVLKVFGWIVDAAREILPPIRRALEGVIDVVGGFVKILAGILSLDFAKVWDGIKDVVGGALRAVANIIDAATRPIRTAFGAIFRGLGSIASGAWELVTDAVKAGLDFILGGVTTLLGIMEDVARMGGKLPFVGDKFDDLADSIGGAKDGLDEFRESLRDTENDTPKMTKAIADAAGRVDALKDRLRGLKRGTDDYRTTARELRRAQADLNKTLREAEGAGGRAARGIGSVAGGASSASGAVASAADTIAANVDDLARKLGAQGITFTPRRGNAGETQGNVFGNLPDYTDPVGGFAHGGHVVGGNRRARGGHVVGGNRRARGGDDRILLGPDGRPEALLGAGELIVFNGDQQAVLDEILRGLGMGGLDAFFSGGWRPHSQTRQYAQGGQIPDMSLAGPAGAYKRAGDGGLGLLNRAAEAFASKLAPKWTGGSTNAFVLKLIKAIGAEGILGLGSGYRSPAHNAAVGGSPTSSHMRGTPSNPGARDVPVSAYGPLAHYGDKLAAAARKAGVPEVIWRAADHYDHVHLGFFGLGGILKRLAGGGWLGKAKKAAGRAQVSSVLGAKGLGGFETKIASMERAYGRRDRLYGMSDEDLVVEDDEGAYIDEDAVKKRTAELTQLQTMRKNILEKIQDYQAAVKRSVGHYEKAVKRIRKALDAIPGAKSKQLAGDGKKAKRSRATAAKMREGYGERLEAYSSRLQDLREVGRGLFDDAADSKLDLKELAQEIKGLDPAATAAMLPDPPEPEKPEEPTLDNRMSDAEKGTLGGLEKAEALAALTADEGDDKTAREGLRGFWQGVLDRLTSEGAPDDVITAAAASLRGYLDLEQPGTPTTPDAPAPAPAAPTIEEIAAAAMAQFDSFRQGAEAAFAEFGSNAVRAGANPFGTQAGLFGGLRHYGAGVDTAPRVEQTVNVTVRDVGEMHTMTQSALHELQAALG